MSSKSNVNNFGSTYRATFLLGLSESSGVLNRFASDDIFDRNVLPLIFQYLSVRMVAIANDFTLSLWANSYLEPVHVFQRTPTLIKFLHWSPNGTMIAVECAQKNLIIFDVSKTEPYWQFQPHLFEILSIAWAPGSRFLATSGLDSDIYLWNVTLKIKYRTIPTPQRSQFIHSLSWSFDRKTLAYISDNRNIILFRTKTKDRKLTLKTNRLHVRQICWSPCRTRLAAAFINGSISIWNGYNGAQIHCLLRPVVKIRSWHCNAFAWSPDGLILAAVSDQGLLYLWDTNTGENIQQIQLPYSSMVQKITYSPDGSMISIAYGCSVHLFHLQTEACIWFPFSNANVYSDIAFCPLIS